jgi:hypothetical protein
VSKLIGKLLGRPFLRLRTSPRSMMTSCSRVTPLYPNSAEAKVVEIHNISFDAAFTRSRALFGGDGFTKQAQASHPPGTPTASEKKPLLVFPAVFAFEESTVYGPDTKALLSGQLSVVETRAATNRNRLQVPRDDSRDADRGEDFESLRPSPHVRPSLCEEHGFSASATKLIA